jgi:hypothetical protein
LLSEITITSLASYSLYGLLGTLLTQYEWVQTWRYLWPLFIGIYYCFDGGLAASAATLLSSDSMSGRILSRIISSLSPLQQEQQQQIEEREVDEEEEENILINTGTTTTTTTITITDLLLQVLKITCGIGLFVGGFADAFLPVWMTGPNFITNAGLAPDCAILLLLLNIIEMVVVVVVVYYNNVNIKDYEYNDDGSSSSGNISQQQQQIMSIIPTSSTVSSSTPTSLPLLLLRITLWAELYKLGESSIDEIISSTTSVFVSISQ